MTSPDLQSIGVLATVARRNVPHVQRAITSLGIVPALRLNGVAYFSTSDAATIARHLTTPTGATPAHPRPRCRRKLRP